MEVMAVDSVYVEQEAGGYKDQPARRWRTYREAGEFDPATELSGGGMEWRSIPGPDWKRGYRDAFKPQLNKSDGV